MATTNKTRGTVRLPTDSLVYRIFVVGLFLILVFVVGEWYGSRTAEQDLVVVEVVVGPEPTPQEIITVVDGVGCVMAPNMIFDKNTGYTTITLVCDPDMLYQHLPAMVVNNDEQPLCVKLPRLLRLHITTMTEISVEDMQKIVDVNEKLVKELKDK